METNNMLNQLTFSKDSPVKTMLLQQEQFDFPQEQYH